MKEVQKSSKSILRFLEKRHARSEDLSVKKTLQGTDIDGKNKNPESSVQRFRVLFL